MPTIFLPILFDGWSIILNLRFGLKQFNTDPQNQNHANNGNPKPSRRKYPKVHPCP